jgi:hypothetical protein
MERLEAPPPLDDAEWEALVAQIENLPEAIEALPPSVKRLKLPTAERFLRRVFGAATYQRLESAFRKDATVVVIALRRGLRFVMPLATAMDQCLRALTPEQRASLPGFTDSPQLSMLELLVQCDTAIQRALDVDLPIDDAPIRPTELAVLTGDITELATIFGADVSRRSEAIVQELSDELIRKLRGARHALEHSPDAISQAANSLVELIDRLLRRSFTDDEVLAWIEANHQDRASSLTYYAAEGVLRPNKRAQALCFAHAGGDVGGNPLFEEMAAVAVVAVRRQLEGLKHADDGREVDTARLLEGFATVEAVLVVVCRVSWLSADESSLEELRGRIGSRAA